MIDTKESFREEFESRNPTIDQKLKVLNEAVGKKDDYKKITEQLINLYESIQQDSNKEQKEQLKIHNIDLQLLVESVVDFMLHRLSSRIDTEEGDTDIAKILGSSRDQRTKRLKFIKEVLPLLYNELGNLAKDQLAHQVTTILTENNPPRPIQLYRWILAVTGQKIK